MSTQTFAIPRFSEHEFVTASDQLLFRAPGVIGGGEAFDRIVTDKLDLLRQRLDHIFRTNVQGAYQSGRWQQQSRNAAVFPYRLYDAVNDSRTRPAHRLMDGIIKPIHDPFWATRYPPNGYRCRCTTVALTERQAAARGGVTQLVPPEAVPDAGWDYHGGEEASS